MTRKTTKRVSESEEQKDSYTRKVLPLLAILRGNSSKEGKTGKKVLVKEHRCSENYEMVEENGQKFGVCKVCGRAL